MDKKSAEIREIRGKNLCEADFDKATGMSLPQNFLLLCGFLRV
ncbi:MAG: hypothetical protein ACI4P6_01845 [Candidatus Spyradosoma sp.]